MGGVLKASPVPQKGECCGSLEVAAGDSKTGGGMEVAGLWLADLGRGTDRKQQVLWKQEPS